jgi:2'-deoxynucleoside 5'-phosphate N-hydrolase
MKVYFSATITEDAQLKSFYKRVMDIVKREGHTILEYGSDRLEPSSLVNRTDTEIQGVYKSLDKFLRSADIYIGEISIPSVGIGYEISQALAQRKPALVLRYQKTGYQPLATLEGNKSAYLRYKTYTDRTLENVIKNFLKHSKDKIDTKFILIIPPEIDRYLEWNVREMGVPKAEVTRTAIEKMMLLDSKYQEYLKNNQPETTE